MTAELKNDPQFKELEMFANDKTPGPREYVFAMDKYDREILRQILKDAVLGDFIRTKMRTYEYLQKCASSQFRYCESDNVAITRGVYGNTPEEAIGLEITVEPQFEYIRAGVPQ